MKTMSSMVRRFYAVSMLKTTLFHVPILVVYLKDTVSSPSRVSILLTAKTLSTLAFEVPTGLVADRFGRKVSVMMSLVLTVVSLVIFVSSASFAVLLLAQVLFGLAETFDSGAYTALLHDNMESAGEQGRFGEALRGISFWSSLSLFAAFILGSLSYSHSRHLPFLGSAVAAALAIFSLQTIEEHGRHGTMTPAEHSYPTRLLKRVLGESGAVFRFLVASSAISAIFYGTYLFLIPLLFISSGLPVSQFGWVFALGVLLFGYGSKLSAVIRESRPFLAVGAPLAAAFIFAAITLSKSIFAIVPLFFALRFLWGAYNVTLGIELNKRIKDSSTRASVLSIASAVEGGLSGIVMLGLGVILGKTSLPFTVLVISISFIVGGLIFYLVDAREGTQGPGGSVKGGPWPG